MANDVGGETTQIIVINPACNRKTLTAVGWPRLRILKIKTKGVSVEPFVLRSLPFPSIFIPVASVLRFTETYDFPHFLNSVPPTPTANGHYPG